MHTARRFAIPVISFLFGTGLQLSGAQAPFVAYVLWGLAAVWGVVAFVTWPPVRDRVAGVLAQVAGVSPFEIRSPVVRRRKTGAAEMTQRGYLDFEQAAVEAMKRMTRRLNELGQETAQIGSTMKRSTPKIAGLIEASTEVKSRLIREIGTKIDRSASRMETHQKAFRTDVDDMTANFLQRLEYLPAAGAIKIRPTIAGMRDAVSTSRPNTVEFRAAVLRLRQQNVQQALNMATDRLIAVLGMLISDFDSVTRFTTSALTVIDETIAAAQVEAVTGEAAQAETRGTAAAKRPRARRKGGSTTAPRDIAER